jgi:hypothetical protein
MAQVSNIGTVCDDSESECEGVGKGVSRSVCFCTTEYWGIFYGTESYGGGIVRRNQSEIE